MSIDPVELLDRLRPPPGWSDPVDLDADPVAAAILERVLADTGEVISLDRARRRRRGVAVAVTVAAVVTGGAVAAIWNRAPQEPRQIACWSAALDPPPMRSLLPWDGVSDPAALCTDVWAAGRLGPPALPADLRVCVTSDGLAAVIPGDEGVCGRLGFADFSPSLDDPAVALLQAQAELDRRFNGSTCRLPTIAETATRPVLDKYDLTGWDITVAGTFGADEPCASVALDPEQATAFVRPVPRQG